MIEWLYEGGIAERRAALVDDDQIIEALIERDGEGLRVGAIVSARLVEARRGGNALIALALPDEPQAVLSDVPTSTAIGAKLLVEITRMGLRERGRVKPAKAHMAKSDSAPHDGPDLLSRIVATGLPVQKLGPTGPDLLEAAGWSERIDAARTGRWPFAGGELWIDPTPAMTMIDIDGDGGGLALATAGARAAVDAIRCFDIGGSIGIDFPSLGSRAERLSIDAVVDASMPQPFERTAVNGFGLMQIIRRRDRPSLIEQVQFDPVATDAAVLLRQAERAQGTGELALTARTAVIDYIGRTSEWTDMLQARTGRRVRLYSDDSLKGAGHAQ